MEVRVFNEIDDLVSIRSFLESRKDSHRHDFFNSQEWFKWKFLQSPNGIAIMPTVFNETEILGANFYGIYPLKKNSESISAIMPYEIFVHEKCQGKGLFKKMINLAEDIAKQRKIQIMLAFPNKKSIQGFVSSGWTFIPNSITYWIKPKISLKFLINILSLKKPFKPNKAAEKNFFEFNLDNNFVYNKDQIHGNWSVEYLEWRFNELPQAEYVQIANSDFELISRIGTRGKLKESQIMYVNFKNQIFNRNNFNDLITKLKKASGSDLVSFPMSSYYPIFDEMRKINFFKLPSGTQFTYKLLDDSLSIDDLKFSLCGLDFHTY